ncbi:MAG: transposase [SAR324 cluster bacterium]|nr:transposase [SAR324 cluster bacterium]
MPLLHYLVSPRGQVSGIIFVDSTSVKDCHNARIRAHKIFNGFAKKGKSAVGGSSDSKYT